MNNNVEKNVHLATITSYLNILNAPIKNMKPEWITKPDPYICCLQETHFKWKDTHRLRANGWKIYFLKMETKQNKKLR